VLQKRIPSPLVKTPHAPDKQNGLCWPVLAAPRSLATGISGKRCGTDRIINFETIGISVTV
jgi:hypothetical protein